MEALRSKNPDSQLSQSNFFPVPSQKVIVGYFLYVWGKKCITPLLQNFSRRLATLAACAAFKHEQHALGH